GTALAEIRQISDTRTAEQVRIATFWALNAGTITGSGFWMELASQDVLQHGLSEREATHVFALVSATMADAQIGCWDAKLTYWLIRHRRTDRSEEHTSELQSRGHLVCRLLLEKKKKNRDAHRV